jgi:uncharacterized protein YbjT (DUF2867 family)
MPPRKILILGATGMLGRPAAGCLQDSGWQVRVLTRDADKARRMLGSQVEIHTGNAANRSDIAAAIAGCNAVHINLTQDVELAATRHVIDAATQTGAGRPPLERISFVSATTAFEANRWFELVDIKLRCEELLRLSGIAHTVFCPTWVMETLHNFVHGQRAVILVGKNPPRLHFFAAADFGRLVAASYDDTRAVGQRLFVHGPQALSLPDAIQRYLHLCHADKPCMRLTLWQARLLARLARRPALAGVAQLIAYFDKVGELGDPSQTDALYGAPKMTLEQWCKAQKFA